MLTVCAALPAYAQPLPELARTAMGIDPAVAGARSQVTAADERVNQARGAFGPTAGIAASKSESRYDEANFGPRTFDNKSLALQVTQPLIRLPLFASLDQAQAQLVQAQAQLRQAETDSLQRLIEACFDVLKARDAVVLTDAQQAATAEQLTAAQRSFKIGTAPITDVREAEARADSVAAQKDAAEHEYDLRQQILAELVGKPVQGLTHRGLNGDRLPVLPPGAIPEWLSNALMNSPQVRQALQALETAEQDVRKAEFGHSPTADLTYSYGRTSDTGSPTTLLPRSALTQQVGLTVNIPLFASGSTQARVREALALREKAQSDVEATRRTLTINVRQGFSSTLSAVSQARGLEAAARSNEIALRANQRGYEVGMRINAEVLDAQTRLFEARRELSRARYDAWINFSKLKALAAQLAEPDLVELEELLVAVTPETIRRGVRVADPTK
jgi:outer membrane protein